MATLEEIRKRSGLLIGVIGFAMLAFILTDLFSSGDSLLRGDATVVGSVEGNKLEYRDFTDKIDQRLTLLQRQSPQQAANFTRVMVADQVWNEFVQSQILEERYADLGLIITDKEFVTRIGQNPQIKDQQVFQDADGKFSMGAFKQYLLDIKEQAASNPEAAQQYDQFMQFEDAIVDQALTQKYQTAIKKGFYMPTALAKNLYERRQEATLAEYVGLEYTTVADSTIKTSDSDLRSYFNDNKNDFERDALRDIAFVSFDIQPSAADVEAIRDELKSYLKPEIIKNRGRIDTLPSFYEAEDDSIFAVGRSDRQVLARYATKDQLPAPLDSILMDKEVGYIHGPYDDMNSLALSKISGISTIPDSVKARHILISFQGANQGQSQSQRAPQAAQALADSLFKAYQKDTTGFSAAAKKLSEDPGSGAKGGDLGWFNRSAMVQPFSRFAFLNKTGDVGLVFSQFGFHIIHIQNQAGENKAIKLVTINRNIEPSEATRDSVYNAANKFASEAAQSEDFGATATNMGYNPKPAIGLTPMQEQVIGLGTNREVVQWAFKEETSVGTVDLFNNNNTYLVVTLTGGTEEGVADFEAVKEQVKVEVVKQKKAEILSEKLNNAGDDVKAIAQAVGSTVKSESLNFGTSNLSGFGSEPEVIGAITAMPVNTLSPAMAGDRGVYRIKVSSRTPGESLPSYESEQVRSATEMGNLANNQIFDSLKKTANIKDNRSKFL
jgi:parvulin-like peptidyl-prolyl isomerase